MYKFNRTSSCFILVLLFGIAIPLVFPGKVFAETGLNKKGAVEFIYSQNRYIVRIRPFDYVLPANTRRFDILLGRNFGPGNAYIYFKSDNANHSWLGSRLDYTISGLNQRLKTIVQTRIFFGLNSSSWKHYYAIFNITYALDSAGRFRPGVLGFGKEVFNPDRVFYIGPSITWRLSRLLGTRISYGKDIFGTDSLLYFKLYCYL